MVLGLHIKKDPSPKRRETNNQPATFAEAHDGEVRPTTRAGVRKNVGAPPPIVKTAAARLVTGHRPDEPVNLDALVATGSQGATLAAMAAAVDEYLNRHPEEAKRVHARLTRIWKLADKDPREFAVQATTLRDEIISLATIDNTIQQTPAAAARLRADLSEYLTVVEGLTRTKA